MICFNCVYMLDIVVLGLMNTEGFAFRGCRRIMFEQELIGMILSSSEESISASSSILSRISSFEDSELLEELDHETSEPM